ncbi:hypothetical protein [Owenweeksia hongkongensis]|uniref:hypothetical protein n=1 Tax=Owenweeksia hongkongensis TaxID=253245 RepID=UPI003A8CA9A4
MRQFFFVILSLVFVHSIYSQQGTIDLTKISVNQIPFKTSQDYLTKHLGSHKTSIVNDDNCRFFESDDDLKFLRYLYPHFTYTGKTTAGFYLEKVDFISSEVRMIYKGKSLSNQTSLKEFCEIFSLKEENTNDSSKNEILLLLSETRDDGARFYFKNGTLSGFEYYFPC